VSAPRIAVVGGGLAGLQAAVACADAGARVQLLEARPRLGGATWSFERHALEVDNGQHVFMRCCTHYRAWLERLGVRDRVTLQPRLAVPVLVPGRAPLWIRRGRLPAPAHLAGSLLRFDALPLAARLRAGATARAFASLDPDDPALDEHSLGEWLRARGESDAAIDGLWDLMIRPTLNLPARHASLALAARVMRTGFLDAADGADVGWSELPLSRLHAEPARDALRRRGAGVALRARVLRVEPVERGAGAVVLRTNAGDLEVDAAIVATPPRPAAEMLHGLAGIDARRAEALGRSPIVSLHSVWDRTVLPHAFAAGLHTPVQWLFDRTKSAGLERGQYVTLSLSAADAYEGRSAASLRAEFEPALRALLPRARDARLEQFFVSCEREATFLQRAGSRRFRPRPGRIAPGVHLAGAWTDTGWPATMESAVRSGLAAARSALEDARARRGAASAEAA
jgi:squalene-associated FAD-dependent desaturase